MIWAPVEGFLVVPDYLAAERPKYYKFVTVVIYGETPG